jgi:hypothetical protein
MLAKYRTLDSLSKIGFFSDFKIPYFSNDSSCDLNLTLVFDKKQTKSIKYPIFDITGNFIGYSEFFFDEMAKPFANVKSLGQESIILTLFDIVQGSFYIDTLKIKQILIANEIKSFQDLNYQCEIVKTVDNLMHKFSSLGRYSSTKCLNNMEDFEVNTDSIPLFIDRSIRESSVITYLRRGTKIKYVFADTTTINHRNQDTYLLMVSTANNNITGWVIYIPEDFIDIKELDVE